MINSIFKKKMMAINLHTKNHLINWGDFFVEFYKKKMEYPKIILKLSNYIASK